MFPPRLVAPVVLGQQALGEGQPVLGNVEVRAGFHAKVQVLHTQGILTCLIVFLFIFHSAYGVRTVLLDLGVKQEKPLFWGCTGAASVLFIVFLALFLTY